MADILFVHTGFPGQLGFIAETMRDRGNRCVAIASKIGRPLPGVPVKRWRSRRGTTQGIFNPAVRAEADLIRAHAAAECALELKKEGFSPQTIVGHPGWGETILLREVFPNAKQVLHGEYYYRAEGGDVGFDPEFGQLSTHDRFRVHAKNATLALSYAEADRIVSPTEFQASRFPELLRSRIDIIHEGVDVATIRKRDEAKLTLPDGRVLDRSSKVITFVSRRLEPLRGFHVLMRALPRFLSQEPEAHVLIVGTDERGGYGPAAPGAATWKSVILAELGTRIDANRVHFLGRVPHETLQNALSISTAHVYYTYPFVLSWSLLEAMASECLIVGSNTAPVREVIEDGRNGLLRDFFDVDALARTLTDICRTPTAFNDMRAAARRTIVDRFDRDRICRPAWLKLIDSL